MIDPQLAGIVVLITGANHGVGAATAQAFAAQGAAVCVAYGISVNVVAPGPVQTGYITPELEAQIAAGTPLGRVGIPEDIADVTVFLASSQAHWLTGQLLYVGGGWRMSQ
jgi:3-oxoacyl-[acyl-carrier protein] reductase